MKKPKKCPMAQFGFTKAKNAHKYGKAVLTEKGVVVSQNCSGHIIDIKVYRGGKGRMKKKCNMCGTEE